MNSLIQVENGQVKIQRECLHTELDLDGSGVRYETGDHVGMWPRNDTADVDRLVRALRLRPEQLDQIFKLSPNSNNPLAMNAKVHFPQPCTLKTALTHYLDLRSPVKQWHLEILSKYARDVSEKDSLQSLASNRELFITNVEKLQCTLSHILLHFPSVVVPIEVVIGELLHAVQVRYYSISSSAKETPKKASLTAAVVRYALPDSFAQEKSVSIRQGLATRLLSEMHHDREFNHLNENTHGQFPNHHLPIYIRRSNFKLPRKPLVPIIMVGPGTGVAPFRGFVRERVFQAEQGTPVGPVWLFFGCRHPDQDYLYKNEWEEMLGKVAKWSQPSDGTSDGDVNVSRKRPKAFDLRIITAFSRVGVS